MPQAYPDDHPNARPGNFQRGERGRDHTLEAALAAVDAHQHALAVQIWLPGDQVVPARVGSEVDALQLELVEIRLR